MTYEWLHAPVNEIISPDVVEFLSELRGLREDRVMMGEHMVLIHALEEFYLERPSRKFVPIIDRNIGAEPLLPERLDRLADTEVYRLLAGLAVMGRSHIEHHTNQKAYVALNALMRPICKRIR